GHTMPRSGLSPRLAGHCPEPFVAVHPVDAAAAGLADGGFARVATEHGACVLKVVVDEGQRPGSLFAPIHWSDTTASDARVGALVSADTDPHSGQPDAKATPASVAPVSFAWRGFAVAREPFALPAQTWWARVALPQGTGVLFASNEPPPAWRAHVPALFGSDLAEYVDAPNLYRVAAWHDGRLAACLFVGPSDAAPQWDAIA